MENSFKFNETNASSINSIADEEGIEVQDDISNHFDQVTGTQMKEIEVKKFEDEITIKRFEKEYRDRKKGVAYTMNKLNEYRRERSNSTELMKRYVMANEALTEKSNELKGFLNEVILTKVENAEKKSAEDKKNISELTMMFQSVTVRDNNIKSLNEKLHFKAIEMNNNITRQIDQKVEEYNKCREKLTKSSSRIEAFKKELNQQTINSNLKDLNEKKLKRIIELETDEAEKLQKQLKQEIDAVLQEKNKLTQDKTNYIKSIQENDKLILHLQSQLESPELVEKKENEVDLKRKAEQLKQDKEEHLNQVAKERENIESLKKSLTDRNADLENELSKIKEKKQILVNNFSIAEESMQAELKKVHDELALKTPLFHKLEYCQKTHWKLNEKKLLSKRTSSNVGLEDKLKKAKDDFKKQEEIRLNLNKNKNNLELKIKELKQKAIEKRKKFDLLEHKENFGGKQIDMQSSTPKKEVTIKKDQVLPKSLGDFSSLFYKLSDSDESEDEFKIKNEIPKNSQKLEHTPFSQKKPLNQSDGKEQNSGKVNVNLSSNELFHNTFTSTQTVAQTEDTTDVFKLPQPLSQYKKKTPQPKKKN